MAFWDRFKRREQSVLPEEVQQYYQSENRQRTGVAVFLGIVALIITILLATGLFYGGRYVYRQINNDDNQTASQQEAQGQSNSGQNSTSPAENKPAETTPTPASNPSATPPATSPTTPPASTAGPALGDTPPSSAPQPLPHTGDPGM